MMRKIVICLTSMTCWCSCVSKWFSDQETGQENSIELTSPKTEGVVDPVVDNNASPTDLKMARLWNKLESLEDEIRLSKERIRLLESGMTTGLSQKASISSKSPSSKGSNLEENIEFQKARISLQKSSKKDHRSDDQNHTASLDNVSVDASARDSKNLDQYKVRVQLAKEYYQSSRFGLAVSEFSQIQKEFGKLAGDGEAKVYLGRSYLALKEYAYAKIEFDEYLEMFPGSDKEADVRLDLSRVYVGMNLRERARSELSAIASKYKGTEAASVALSEMEKMKGTL